ncbi:VacJ family lipoprotein [uncultured Desulfovibrio sp.]|uniref:MlaA family lipoprotein n=1 Tax=Desulfovibrio legallii TaxID=571438 RepID=UPI002205C552|nr:VacJ family lipoprotein [uncultured Desulfovibrio sp.]CAI3241274.1 Outer-membrane-phospholipid-binding lipoprotein MlaA [Desulfovibrio diazotrophicus]
MATDRRALAWRFLHGGLLALFALFCCLRAAPVTAAPAAEPTPSAVYGNAPALPPGAVTVHPYGTMRVSDSLDDYDDAPLSAIADPLEPWNRFWFHFNDIFFLYVAKPVYTAWEYITPHQLRSGLKNFFSNILFPVRFINNILQFRFMEAGVEFGRFFINTTTSAGFADVAKGLKTVVPVDPAGEDFGQTLGRWGLGHGFYLVWPFIGPSSARDTVGRVGDLFAEPMFYLQPWELSAATGGGLRFNALGDVLPLYDDLNSVAVDPYIAMREAYVSFRRAQVLH